MVLDFGALHENVVIAFNRYMQLVRE